MRMYLRGDSKRIARRARGECVVSLSAGAEQFIRLADDDAMFISVKAGVL